MNLRHSFFHKSINMVIDEIRESFPGSSCVCFRIYKCQ